VKQYESTDPSTSEETMHTKSLDEGAVVCYVTPDGEVVCMKANAIEEYQIVPSAGEELKRSIESAFPKGNWGPNKIELALAVLNTLANSKLPDSPNIPRRHGQIVDSVARLLQTEPPSILLYNYSEQPANVMGAWFLNRAELVRMHKIARQFGTPVQP
jgi:hypothetical protein